MSHLICGLLNSVFLGSTIAATLPTRYYAYVRDSFKNERTKWLAIIWLIIFVLAVALLVGLLVRRGTLHFEPQH